MSLGLPEIESHFRHASEYLHADWATDAVRKHCCRQMHVAEHWCPSRQDTARGRRSHRAHIRGAVLLKVFTRPLPSTPVPALTQAQEYAEIIQTKWEETEEKPAVIAISIAAFVAIWAASGVIVSASRMPRPTLPLCAY